MVVIFRLAAACDLALNALHACVPGLHWIPIGGGHLQQIAIVFIAAFTCLEAKEGFRKLLEALRR